jgi:polyribonucleotide nucleotidyltransferase
MVPLKEFPYAVRVTSEIMESNGSTSMASICAGTLALMDAGVPLIRPVAGISIGLCSETDDNDVISDYRLLTDIIGWEDAFGDMDCKFAGTTQGITGFQLDLKLRGLPHKILAEALEKARLARLKILDSMLATLAEPRKELNKYAPRIVTVKINPEKIGALIGPGGKNIKRLVEESGCEINIEDDGTVHIYSVNEDGMRLARESIEGMCAEAEIGKIYRGKVVTIKEFGAFVEFLPGKDGLVHISELSSKRVNKTEDVVKMGDEIHVKCLGVDEKGRVRLSRKAAMEERGEAVAAGEGEAAADAAPAEGGEGEAKPEGRGERGGRGRGERGGRGGEGKGDRPKGGRKEPATPAEDGKIYRAKVVSIKDFGCFVEYMPESEGLVHVSELANFRVKQVEDIVKLGDEIWVKCVGTDERGRVRFSRKAAMEEREKAEGGGEAAAAPAEAAPEAKA